MDRMPNPKKPIIEVTPRVQLAAAVVILTVSAMLGSLLTASDGPRQAQFDRNFAAPLIVVPPAPDPPAAPAELPRTETPEAPRQPAKSSVI
jgi:hypothetical protein